MCREIRGRLAAAGVSQEELARLLRIHPSVLSRILRRRLKAPPDLRTRIDHALDLVARAERAASEARDRVLAGPPEAA